MIQDVLLPRRCETAGLALEERRCGPGSRIGRRRLRGDLQEDRLGIVEEEVREVLELVGVEVALQLADDRTERLRLGQNLHLTVERTRPLLEARTTVVRLAAFAEAATGRLVSERLALAERLPVAERLAFAETLSGRASSVS